MYFTSHVLSDQHTVLQQVMIHSVYKCIYPPEVEFGTKSLKDSTKVGVEYVLAALHSFEFSLCHESCAFETFEAVEDLE
jgi:hypothetical protein